MLESLDGLDSAVMACPKIDVHTHIGWEDGPADLDGVRRYLDEVAQLGIEQVWISRPFLGGGASSPSTAHMMRGNDAVMAAVQAFPGKVRGYAFLHAGYHAWSIDEMERCLAVEGMIGIKLYNQYRFDDPAVITLVQAAAERNAVVLLHQAKGTDAETLATQPSLSDGYHVAELARRVPKAKIICGHIGGGGDWEWTVKALKHAPQVYLDIGGSVIDDGMIQFCVRELGVGRLLFATDMSTEEGVGKIMAAELPAAARDAICCGNAKRLLAEVAR